MELPGRSVDTCGLDLFQRLRKGEEKKDLQCYLQVFFALQ